jgi:hypothetical protein
MAALPSPLSSLAGWAAAVVQSAIPEDPQPMGVDSDCLRQNPSHRQHLHHHRLEVRRWGAVTCDQYRRSVRKVILVVMWG